MQEEAKAEVVTRVWASQTDSAGKRGQWEPGKARGRERRGGRRLQVGLGPLPSTGLYSASRRLERTHQRLDVKMIERRENAPNLHT